MNETGCRSIRERFWRRGRSKSICPNHPEELTSTASPLRPKSVTISVPTRAFVEYVAKQLRPRLFGLIAHTDVRIFGEWPLCAKSGRSITTHYANPNARRIGVIAK